MSPGRKNDATASLTRPGRTRNCRAGPTRTRALAEQLIPLPFEPFQGFCRVPRNSPALQSPRCVSRAYAICPRPVLSSSRDFLRASETSALSMNLEMSTRSNDYLLSAFIGCRYPNAGCRSVGFVAAEKLALLLTERTSLLMVHSALQQFLDRPGFRARYIEWWLQPRP